MAVIFLFEPFNIILRVVLALILLLAATKSLTKRSLAHLTYFDYVAGVTLGTIAGNLTFNLNIGISDFILSITVTTLIIFLVAYFSLKYEPLRRIVAGKPTILIENGKILESNMAKLNYTFDYLVQQLRQEKVFDIDQVEFAILEPSGKLSVQLKAQFRPLTPQDLNLSTSYVGLATEVILEGKIIGKNLLKSSLNNEWLYQELNKKGIQSTKDVAFAVLSTNGNLYVDLYKDEE